VAKPFARSRNGDDQPHDLRRQLALGGVALVTVASVLIGLVSSFVVGRLLLEDLDRDLRQAAVRLDQVVSAGSDPVGPSSRLDRPGFQVGTLIAVTDGQEVSGAFIDFDGSLQLVSADQLRAVLTHEFPLGEPTTIRVFGGAGEYRTLLVQQVEGTRVIVGLPMAEIRNTIGRLNILILAIAITVITFAGGLGAYGARMTLRPLDRMRATAQQVTAQRLDRGQVTVGFRVPKELANPDTEIGQLGDAMNRMLDHVDDAFRTRYSSEARMRRFVQDASHELRTPLASIRGYSEFATRFADQLPADVGKALERIESESVRMTHLVDDLLTLARLDEGENLRVRPVELTALVDKVVQDAAIRGEGHILEWEPPESALLIEADQEALFRVLTNLVTNAIVHTPDGTLVSVSVDQEGDWAIIEVEDNGPGIDQELLPGIFERFRKHPGRVSRKPGSTGLGLSIAKTIVTAHHGTIDVSSEPGRTVFEVRIPTQFVQTAAIPLS
jgi:two-component system, OmpR family, sensor kinase